MKNAPPVPPIQRGSLPFGAVGDLFPYPIEFDPSDAAHVSLDRDGSVRIRVVAPAGLTGATLVLPGDEPRGAAFTMVGSAGDVALWSVSLPAPEASMEYGIAFAWNPSRTSPVHLSPSGITNAFERLDYFLLDPAKLRAHEIPQWAEGALIYQIFPDRFANGDPLTDPVGTAEWGSAPDNRVFQGGDLKGIADRVDYLAMLGVDAIYLNPIFVSPSTHRYDTIDYYSVDPVLGGNAALSHLVEVLHAHEIRVILDASLNHVHPRFFAFADVIERGPESEFADWFQVSSWPIHVDYRPAATQPGDYARRMVGWLEEATGIAVHEVGGSGPAVVPSFDAWYGVPTMPRVNLANPDARRYMLDVAKHWIEEFNIDGWRMDVVRYVDTDFWPEFRAATRQANPETYLIAELAGDGHRWLQGDQFDATMNYTWRDLCLGFFAHGTLDAERFKEGYLRLLGMYSAAVTAANHNLLSSHDTERFLTAAGGDERATELATLFQMTSPGAPGVYYGEERRMAGANDPLCRGAVVWDDEAATNSAREFARVSSLRTTVPALRSGGFRLLDVAGAVAYQRTSLDGDVTVAITGAESATFPAPGTVIHTIGEVAVGDGMASLGPKSAVVLS